MPNQPTPKRPASAPQEEDSPFVPKAPSRLRKALRRVGLCVLLALAIVFAYVFLLLGEPDDDAKQLVRPVEERIRMPMTALEIPEATHLENVSDTFGQPVLSFGDALSVCKARIYDTAFEGGYARRVTLTCALADGTLCTVESLRPTSAVTLLHLEGGTLDGSNLYTLGGLNAARMDNQTTLCIFAQSDQAVYAVVCPLSHAEELTSLLRYTMLVQPEKDNQEQPQA